MSHDAINNWVEKAKMSAQLDVPSASGVQVVRRADGASTGTMIMAVADRLRPWFTELFKDVRDEHGMLVQPARIRGIALNVAQRIVNEQEKKSA